MKKLLFLFAVLLTSVGAWAQVQPGRRTLDLQEGKKYFISAATSHGGVYTNLLKIGEVEGKKTIVFSSHKPTDVIIEEEKSVYLFTVEKKIDDGTYYLKNDAANMYLLSGSPILTGEQTAIKIVPYGKAGVKGTYTCGNDVNACDALGNIITYNNITEETPIVCVYEQYIEGETTKDRGWRGIGSFTIGKTTPFAFYEVNSEIFNVTYKFVDTEKNILHTETFTASEGSALLNAHNFLKVPSNVVTLTNAPTGEASSETKEYIITVSYNNNFPFVPTTIVDGNFAQGTKWYNMKVRHGNDRKRLKAVGDDLQENPSWNDYRDMNQYFAFTGDPLNGFYLHNKNLGESKVFSCVVDESTTGNVDGKFSIDNGVAMELFSRNGYWQFAPIVRPIANARIHDLNGNLGYWHSSGANGDAGSDFTIFCVDVEAGIKTANFQFKENGVVRYEESATAYPGYDIKISQPLGVVPNTSLEYMPSAEGDIEVEWTLNVPFEYYSSYNEIKKWYYLKFDAGNNYFLYHQDEADYIALNRQELDINDLESHSWAFVGNPFDGYMIYNKATGSSKILSSSTTMAGTTGAGTWPVLTPTPVPDGNNELWFARVSSYATNGFYLEQKGHSANKLNNRGQLAYWTAGENSGSTFVVEDAIPVRLTTDGNPPIYYALKTGRTFEVNKIPAEWWYNYDDDKISLTQFNDSEAQWWYFKGKNVDKKLYVQLVPKADPTKMMSYANSNDEAEKIIAQPDETPGYTNTWRFAFKGGRYVLQTSDGRSYLSQNGGNGKKMGLYSGNSDTDGGTALYIYETMPFELTDNAGNAYTGTSLYQLESLALTFTGSHALALSNIERGETFTADVDFGIPVSKTDGSADNLFLITPFGSGNSLRYYVDGNYDVLVNKSAFTSANVDNYQWAVYPCLSGNEFSFVIKNYGTGRYIKTNKTESSGVIDDESAVTVVEDIKDATHFTLETNNWFKIPGYELRMSVTSSSESQQYVTVHTGHGGCNTSFTVVSDVVNNWKTDNGSKVGYVGFYPRNLSDKIAAIESYSDLLFFQESYVNDVIALKEGYYLIKGTGTGNNADWYATMTDGNKFNAQALANAAELGASQLIRLVSCDKGYRFQAYGNSRYVTLDNASTNGGSASNIASLENEGTKFTFTDNGSGKFTIKGVFVVTPENGEPMEESHFMRTENGGAINYWDTESNETWYLIQAPELPLTIHSTGYSTFSAAVGVDVPEGVTAYYAKEQIGDSHIRMYPITTIPANTGVVLKGAGSAEVKFPIIANAAELPEENLLKAHLNTGAVTSDNSVFVMATKNGYTGFYPLSTTNNVIGGHKSYLEIPSTSAARLSIVWDDTETGIFETEGGEQNAEIYDLTGRRLDKPTKGVNVVGGKLVIN